MFIEQSASRVRLARTLFVLAGLLPCAALVAWAVLRQSDWHLQLLRREGEQVLGLPLEIGSVEHLTPGAIRLRSCCLRSPQGETLVAIPVVDVELTPTEVRLRLPRFECTPQEARTLAAIARAWLREPVRFSRAWVVDVDEFIFLAGSALAKAPQVRLPSAESLAESKRSGLHIECVAAGETRAVRLRRDQDSPDEVRVISTLPPKAFQNFSGRQNGLSEKCVLQEPAIGSRAEPKEDSGSERLEISGAIQEPLPLPILTALMGPSLGNHVASLGPHAEVRGSINAVLTDGTWHGDASGEVQRIDLAATTLFLPHRVTGQASLTIPRLTWEGSRLQECQLECVVGSGQMSMSLLDACVVTLGCRGGTGYRSLSQQAMRDFDSMACCVRIDPHGFELRARPDRSGSLLRSHGLSLLDEPSRTISTEKVAWIFSAPGTVTVPATDMSAWLISVLPVPASRF